MENTDNLTPRARRELRKFFPTAYWAIGGLCFYWATVIISGLLRPEQEMELPIIGKCGSGEAIIFTLTFLWPVLLIAHLLVYGYQRVAAKGSFSAQFPGVLGDQEIPKTLRAVRVVLFAIFIVWPTVVYAVLAVRSFTHMGIALKVGDQVPVWKNEPFKNGEENYVWHRGWSALLGGAKLPDEFPKDKKPDWRWLHWRDATPVAAEPTPKKAELVDAAGTPLTVMLDAQGKPIPIPRKDGAAKEEKKEPRENVVRKPTHWPTALPFWQPLWNLLSMVGFGGSVIWLGLPGPIKQAIRRIRERIFGKKQKTQEEPATKK